MATPILQIPPYRRPANNTSPVPTACAIPSSTASATALSSATSAANMNMNMNMSMDYQMSSAMSVDPAPYSPHHPAQHQPQHRQSQFQESRSSYSPSARPALVAHAVTDPPSPPYHAHLNVHQGNSFAHSHNPTNSLAHALNHTLNYSPAHSLSQTLKQQPRSQPQSPQPQHQQLHRPSPSASPPAPHHAQSHPQPQASLDLQPRSYWHSQPVSPALAPSHGLGPGSEVSSSPHQYLSHHPHHHVHHHNHTQAPRSAQHPFALPLPSPSHVLPSQRQSSSPHLHSIPLSRSGSRRGVLEREREREWDRQRSRERERERKRSWAKSSRDPDLGVDDFELIRTLGTGTFARVWLARLANPVPEEADKLYALKVLRKAQVVKLKQVDHVNHERSLLQDVAGHPFITSFNNSFSDRDCLYMLLDYCPGGEVFSYLRKAKYFDEDTSRFYAAEIVLIFEFLHEREGIAYRDLKPENLLLDAEGHIKLVDFGFAKRLRDRETYTLCGTPEYLAPEVIQSKGHTTAVDWWALGVLIYEFLTGYPPFWDSLPIEIYKKIVSKPLTFPADPPISPEARDIIRRFCTVDRFHRLGNINGGAARVKAHPFFRDVYWDDIYHRRSRGPIIPPVRYHGDTRCFDVYPDEDERPEPYTAAMRDEYESAFEDF